MIKTILPMISLALCVAVAHAQDQGQPLDQDGQPATGGGFLDVPTVIPSPITGEAVEPEITIIESGDQVVYEYRVRGQLYMVRIQPQIGPPYYLFDSDGDGVLDAQDSSPTNIAIPQWVLFRWN